jgi:hypothetical protein
MTSLVVTTKRWEVDCRDSSAKKEQVRYASYIVVLDKAAGRLTVTITPEITRYCDDATRHATTILHRMYTDSRITGYDERYDI